VAGLVQDVELRPLILMSLYRNYARAIVPTTFIADAYARNGFRGEMTRIPFGVDIDRREKPAATAGRPIVLGFVGQLMAHKGPDILIEAARAALLPENYEVRIYGSEGQDPAYMARLRRDAAGLPVRFMGTFPSSEMRAVLDTFDVLVIPSRWYENSPLVLLNALASHTPVIVSDVAGMTEFVQDGVNGFAFERGSAAALAKILRRIAADRTILPRMSAATDYDVTTRAMTQRTLAVYAHAIAGEPARG
jgi:glycosyltransferase involved in cell wall biosynthesis